MKSEKGKQFLIRTMQEFYRFHPLEGALHIVLGDLNVEDEHIEFCKTQIDELCEYGYEKDLCNVIANELLKYSPEERVDLILQAHNQMN